MKRVIATFLLLVFISGQINLTWADHYCGKRIVKSALMLGHGHLDCGMIEMMACDAETSESDTKAFKAVSCCSNAYYSAESDEFFNKSETSVQQIPVFIVAFTYSLFDSSIHTEDVEFSLIPQPPLILTDRYLHLRVLLI
jgi:hypothetical protein